MHVPRSRSCSESTAYHQSTPKPIEWHESQTQNHEKPSTIYDTGTTTSTKPLCRRVNPHLGMLIGVAMLTPKQKIDNEPQQSQPITSHEATSSKNNDKNNTNREFSSWVSSSGSKFHLSPASRGLLVLTGSKPEMRA